jgi:hypothetical protein
MKNYEPYSGDTNDLTLNSEDSIYLDQGGEYGLLNLVSLGTDYSAGFLGSVTFGVEVDDMSVSSSSSATSSYVGTTEGVSGVIGTTIPSTVPTQASSFAEKSRALTGVLGGAIIIATGVFLIGE